MALEFSSITFPSTVDQSGVVEVTAYVTGYTGTPYCYLSIGGQEIAGGYMTGGLITLKLSYFFDADYDFFVEVFDDVDYIVSSPYNVTVYAKNEFATYSDMTVGLNEIVELDDTVDFQQYYVESNHCPVESEYLLFGNLYSATHEYAETPSTQYLSVVGGTAFHSVDQLMFISSGATVTPTMFSNKVLNMLEIRFDMWDDFDTLWDNDTGSETIASFTVLGTNTWYNFGAAKRYDFVEGEYIPCIRIDSFFHGDQTHQTYDYRIYSKPDNIVVKMHFVADQLSRTSFTCSGITKFDNYFNVPSNLYFGSMCPKIQTSSSYARTRWIYGWGNFVIGGTCIGEYEDVFTSGIKIVVKDQEGSEIEDTSDIIQIITPKKIKVIKSGYIITIYPQIISDGEVVDTTDDPYTIDIAPGIYILSTNKYGKNRLQTQLSVAYIE